MTMSLDGYIADPDDQVGELFDWYAAGEVVRGERATRPSRSTSTRPARSRFELIEHGGALVSGRRLFDVADGWNDDPIRARAQVRRGSTPRAPPANAAERWPRTTVRRRGRSGDRQGARRSTGDKDVMIASANVIQQALDLGLVDEVTRQASYAVLFGEGCPPASPSWMPWGQCCSRTRS